ncbi:MAG: hypothetical protein ACYC23_22645 [Limisphaerales bacterium]
MATKQELEKQIETLNGEIREQARALQLLSSDVGMEVGLPWREYTGNRGDAPLITDEKRNDVWLKKVLPIVARVISEKGISAGISGASHDSVLDLNDSHSHGKRYVIPSIAGEILIALMNAAAEFGRLCYRDGVAEGAGLLQQLANGQMTASDFEDRIAIEQAGRIQKHKQYRSRKVARD